MTNYNDEDTDLKDGMVIALERIEEARTTGATLLNLSSLYLVEIPESICSLTEVRWLNLSKNYLAALPEWFGQLTQLKRLDLSRNHLTTLSDCVGRLVHLERLDVDHNQLTTVTNSIGQLLLLERLYLDNNQLVILPNSICQLKQVYELDLSNNKLIVIPEDIGKLVNLVRLDLSGNELKSLPESVGLWTQVRELYLSNNKLIDLPQSLMFLSSLAHLYLHGNPRLQLPEEILGESSNSRAPGFRGAKPATILEYYFRTRGNRLPLNEAKLILVGRGGVGKTSLVKRLVHEQFERVEKKTEGIQITEWKRIINGDEEVRLNVWDFGGQEIMHATHQFFLTQRSLYILVLNGREDREDTDAEYWLKLIESFGGESPVIVVLNKIKEQPFDLNYRALQQKYPSIREFVKTDCENGSGIDVLRRAIDRETDRLEHLRDAFPASWFEIKDQLSRMHQNYLEFDEYQAFCAQCGETDVGAQEALAGYLHQLGIILNYKDDPRLQDTHVLNPHWVTTGIYKILNSEKLAQQKGQIHLNDVATILDINEYPSKMRRFIFDLMKKFDLCFSFPDDECHYLVPELLDKQEPEETAEFDPEECLNFQYHYPILPEGLLPRFTVRTHHLSEKVPNSRWRTGVILEFEGNRALVKADVTDKKVLIYVSGTIGGRRRLLTLIRIGFDSIHHGIRNLQPQEMVPLPRYPNVLVPYKTLQVMEEKGKKMLSWVVEDDVIDLDIQELLNGVALEHTSKRERAMDGRAEAVRVFYSYSHKDEQLRNDLETHLKLLHRQGLIDAWHDRQIEAGEEWKDKIDENLERADIILLLISSDFIASDYCYEKEMTRALEKHEDGSARVIPVILRTCNWYNAPFGKLQALPRDAKPITTWSDRDTAWADAASGIERVVETLQKKQRG